MRTLLRSSRLNWHTSRPVDLNGLVRFARKTKSGFCACAVTFKRLSTCSRQLYGIGRLHTVRLSSVIYGRLSWKAKTNSHFTADSTAEPRDTINEHPVSDYKKTPSLNVCTCEEYCKKGKSVPLQVYSVPEGSRKLRFPDFMTTARDGGKVVSHTHRPPLPRRKYSRYSFLLEAESTPGP